MPASARLSLPLIALAALVGLSALSPVLSPALA